MKQIHLLCNAHLDPVWLWSWEEGVTEAISTFRTVCDLLEEFDEFEFNHNEAILYEWVRQYDPALFERIRKWVEAGRWHIMGGWYLQPDCNMPEGESIIRNIQRGRRFFKKEFGKEPTTAINFDSFGHSKGLVQIFRQAGYDSYLIFRAGKAQSIPKSDFIWKGLNDSEIVVHRSDNYSTALGDAVNRVEGHLRKYGDEPISLFLWGVGDHGGGPSRCDLNDLRALFKKRDDLQFIHSSAEGYFSALRALDVPLPEWKEGLNPVADGCYTSQIRVKQKHRQLENELYSAEKMAVAAELTAGAPYPADTFRQVEYDLIFSEFHDALPGSAIKRVEEDTLRLLDHGLEALAREKLRSALALSAGQGKVLDGCSTVLVYNPHPFEYDGLVEFETGMPAQNWDDVFYYPECWLNGVRVPTQCEMEENRFAIDWRKRAVIRAKLPALSMSRLDVHFRAIDKRPTFEPIINNPSFEFDNGEMQLSINMATGLIDRYAVGGREIFGKGSMQLVAYQDNFNPWQLETRVRGRRPFRLMTDAEATAFSALKYLAPPIRVIEDGPIRTVVEALFTMNGSNAYLRYLLPKQGTEFDVEAGVYWSEKEMYLKLEMESLLENPEFLGQVPFGTDTLWQGEEVVSQRFLALRDAARAVSVMGDSGYGSSFKDGRLGLTVLRGAAHSAAHCGKSRALGELRYTPRMEQGERLFHWRFAAGAPEMLDGIGNRALMLNEKPYVMSLNPSGEGEKPAQLMTIDNPAVVVSALKKAESGDRYILRVYEADGKRQSARIALPPFGIDQAIELNGYELATFAIYPEEGRMERTDLLELDV